MKKDFNEETKFPFFYQFEISENGLYSLTIKASCKPGWRNRWWLKFRNILEDILDVHLDDEDLRVEIDGKVFRKPKGKRGLFNSPAAFSGTKSLGKTKTLIFIVYLNKGSQTIKFIPDGSPYVESVEIAKLDNPQKLTFYLNAQAQDEDYYSWFTFALVDLPLKSVSITAQAGVRKGGKDDDDLKIVINSEIQKNPSNRHQHSYFCGFRSKDREETFTKDLDFGKAIHYIELFADRTPILKFIEIDFGVAQITAQIQKYTDDRYNQYDDEITKVTESWNNFFLKQKHPPSTPLDPNLVKAIVYIESRMGYGSSPTGHLAFPDIMQVGNPEDPALHVLNNDGKFPTEYEAYSGKVEPLSYRGEAKVSTPHESMYWGARWLYHKAQGVGPEEKQVWFSWKEAMRGYGPGTKEYVDNVWNLYIRGTNPDGKKSLF